MAKKKATHGPVAVAPEGFAYELELCGRTISILYFEWIKEDGAFDSGQMFIDTGEIWISTKTTDGRDVLPSVIADNIWHEAKHWAATYAELGDEEERIIRFFELTDPALLRENPWFHALYGEKK